MIEVDWGCTSAKAQAVQEGLAAFNNSFFGNDPMLSFGLYLTDQKGELIGGLLAWMRTGINTLFIDTLWIKENYRRQGHASQILLFAETEAKNRGCIYSQVETLPFQAESFYKKHGYIRIGVVEKLYGEHDAIFLRKKLG